MERPAIRPLRADCTASHTHNAMTSGISPSAAIDMIRKRQAVRVYAETPALKLLGLEDKYAARLKWKQQFEKPITDSEKQTLDSVRNELAKRQNADLIVAREEFRRRNKISSYFPDEGPLRRELYPRHMEFVDATRTDDEVGMLAANRCLTPWTAIETDRGERQVLELIGEAGFDVPSWDGNSRCTKKASPVFLVGIEPAFQIHLDNGEVFQCSGRHRVLRHDWMDARLPAAWCSVGQLIREISGLHLNRTARGWLASYGAGDRLYDEPLLPQLESGSAQLPRPLGVPSNDRSYWRADEAASISGRSRAYQERGPFSTSDDRHRLVDLCGKIGAPSASLFALPKTLRDQISLQLRCGLTPEPEGILAAVGSQLSSLPEISKLLLAFDSPSIFNGRSIVAVVPIGLQPIIDFSVPGTHNYLASGIVHHNTGKTQLGAICVSNWATGRYPDWWNGRTFDGPTTGWIMNKTAKDVRDINEAELLGPPGHEAERGTGMIPAHLIQKCTPKPGTPHAFEFISVEHASGATSYIVSKSYDQGREAFQGRAISYGWADEEISLELWDECRLRTMTTSGILIFSYTPINGLTEMTMNFMESAGLSIEQMRNQGAV